MAVSACISVMTLLYLAGNAAAGRRGPQEPSSQHTLRFPRPEPIKFANMARWLVHESEWGTLSAISKDKQPVGGAVSFADGDVNTPTGRPYFYLTPMDEITQAVKVNSAAALSITEAQRLPHGCGQTDPEDPTCARVTLLGTMQRVPQEDVKAVEAALFDRHPAMRRWPSDHNWELFELRVESAHLLDMYGGMHVISRDDYYAAELDPASIRAQSTAQAAM